MTDQPKKGDEVRREVLSTNAYSQRIRYGNWVCMVLDSGDAAWEWLPLRGGQYAAYGQA